MRLLFLTAGLIFCANHAAGQTLRVQAGDHAGFTRLVISAGANRDWEIVAEDDRTYTVAMVPQVDGFDTSETFDLIQRNRLANLLDDGSLTLSLACACEISSFRHLDDYIVIDIADPDPSRDLEATNTPRRDEESLLLEERTRAADALPDLASLLLGPTQLPEVDFAPQPAPVGEVPASASPTPPNPRLAEAAEIMAEQLARAAASGLLDASLGQPQTFADPVASAASNTVDDQATQVPEDAVQPEGQTVSHEIRSPHPTEDELPIETHTALDPIISFDTPLSPTNESQICSSEPLDARDWTEAESFEQGLGELRLALYDDRDALTVDGAQALALHYLHYGFGAEARHLLMQVPEPPQEYLRIADLVDGSENAAFEPITSTAGCSQGEILWRYIAGAIAVDLNTDDLAAIQRAYTELPVHLRDLMGPRLARALHSDRHGPAARNIRDILHRGGRLPEAGLQLLDLDLGISIAMSEDETRDALGDMLANSGANAVETMAQALAFDRNAGIPPTAERLIAAEALLREAGASAQSDILWQEVLLGHAAQGSIDTAIAMLGDPERAANAQANALTALIAERVAVEDTTGLLILAHTFGGDWRPEGSEAGRAQVAAIALLRAEGLFEAANILSNVRRPLILPERQDLETDQPDPVMQAWENADWPELSEIADGPHAEVANRMIALAENPPDLAAALDDLAAVSGAVDDSRSLRAAIAALLQQPSPN